MNTEHFDVIGINSDLPDGRHIVMFDFDDIPLGQVIGELTKIQNKYSLPSITIIENTDKYQHYHAYCFHAVNRDLLVKLLCEIPSICNSFIRFGIVRGYWTLRITDGGKGGFRFVTSLQSSVNGNLPFNIWADNLNVSKYTTGVK